MRRPLLITVILLAVLNGPANSQEAIEMEDGYAVVIDRVGSATLLKSHGRQISGSGLSARNVQQELEWYFVQDSSLGLVFRKPSGIHLDSDGDYNGDIDLISLENISAYEVRAVLYDVWRNRITTLSMTRIRYRAADQKFDHDPGWYWGDYRMFTSVLFVARVKYEDGTIVEADLEPILRAAQSIDQGITKQDLLPDEPPPGTQKGLVGTGRT